MKSGLTEKWLVCRICLRQPKESMQTIFDKDAEKDLTRMILECGGVPIKQFDHYPDKICSTCLKLLQMAYKFRSTCQRSHKQLSHFIAPVVVEKSEYTDYEDDVTTVPVPITLKEEVLDVDEEGENMLLKIENTQDENTKEDFTLQLEDDFDDFVEYYEPMTEEDDQELLEFGVLEKDEFTNNDVVDQDVEYLEVEENFDIPTTDDEDYNPTETLKKKGRGRPPLKRDNISQASTSYGGTTKRLKREPREKKLKDSSYICDFCGNKYPSQGRLTEHIKLHKGIKPHECEICGHAFAQTQQLARHMNTHTGNRPYKCSYCPAAFADLSTRNKHHRIHTNERPYACDVCGKTFTYTNTLKFHKMIHTGEKPFVCDICGKGFQQAYKLRSHKMIHEKKGIKMAKSEIVDTGNETNFQDIQLDTVTQILNI